MTMDPNELIERGNQLRAEHRPLEALKCYAQVFIDYPDAAAAWNNYGNVLRECGEPARAVPFLEHAIILDPNNVTSKFNLAVTRLILGDYARGWPLYEVRWNYEHLAGTEPKFSQPKWKGEDLKGKTILVVGEQGHGDNIQFCRFLYNLHAAGAKVKFQTTDGLIPIFKYSSVISQISNYVDNPGEFDYWIPIMSIPGIIGVTLENLPRNNGYLTADQNLVNNWLDILGPKTKLRVGIAWSGRRDAWLNEHKGMPFESVCKLIKTNPQYEWINLQVDATPEESSILETIGVRLFPGKVTSFADTAALMQHLDVILSVDTAVAHLAGALNRPTWLMLNWFATDWRWLLDKDSSPWYPSLRIFRQPKQDDWDSVTEKISKFLSWFKV